MKIKKKVALSGLLLCCAITAKAQVCITPQVEQRARELVSQMTLEEKIDYISSMGAAHPTCIPCSKAVKKAQSSAKGGLRPFAEPRGGS